MTHIWPDIQRPKINLLSPVYHITEAIGSLTSEPVPDFYRSMTDRAVIVKDLLRERLHEKGLGVTDIGRYEALWTGSKTHHSTIIHSLDKDHRPLANKYHDFYQKAKSKINQL